MKFAHCTVCMSAIVSMTLFAGVNRNYGNCDADGRNFEYAPDSLVCRGGWKYMTSLTGSDYADAGWWPVRDTPPTVSTNERAVAVGWTKSSYVITCDTVDYVPDDPAVTNAHGDVVLHAVTNTAAGTAYVIDRVYEKRAANVRPTTYRAWTPLTIMRGAKAAGIWTAVKQVLDENDAFDEFIAAHYCAECDPGFAAIRALFVAQIGEERTVEFLNGLKVERRGTASMLTGAAK